MWLTSSDLVWLSASYISKLEGQFAQVTTYVCLRPFSLEIQFKVGAEADDEG